MSCRRKEEKKFLFLVVLLMVMNNPLPCPTESGLSAKPPHPVLPIPYPIPLLITGLNGIHFQPNGSLKGRNQQGRCSCLLSFLGPFWRIDHLRKLFQCVMPGCIGLLAEPCPASGEAK